MSSQIKNTHTHWTDYTDSQNI